MTAAEARELVRLRQQVREEQVKRRTAERKSAGLRTAILKLQAQIARVKADAAERKAGVNAHDPR